MRFFVVLTTLCLLSAPAFATPVSKDAANAYYQNCKSQSAEGMSRKSQDFMCACTAAKMMDHMSVEDVKMMGQQNESGRKATNKMIIQVYAPCIEYPARDHYYNNCISDPKTKTMTSSPKAMCSCMAGEIADHLKNNAQTVFREILTRNPNITDPMGALTSDPEFQQFARRKLLGCVR